MAEVLHGTTPTPASGTPAATADTAPSGAPAPGPPASGTPAPTPRTDAPGASASPAGGRAPRPAVLGVALAALATVVWAGSFVTSRALHDSVPPVQHAFWRWVVALVAVAPFGARAAWRQRALVRRHLRFVLLASLLGVTVYNTLVNQAGLTTPAANMGMIMAASPVLMAVLERAGGVRLGARRVTGLLTACAGVVLLIGGGGAASFSAGDLWMIAAACSFGSYSALLRRRPAELAGAAFLFTTFLFGTVMLLPVQVASVAVQGGFDVRPGTVLPLLYVGVLSSAVAFFSWNKAISLVGPTRAGLVYYLQPVCVAVLSWALLGEAVGPLQALCMALILGGVVLGTASRR
ncbi:DMT family transporter [Streptomyces sp. NPDC006743]|uniref:DMT family transporter n=1 Tax=Streptomyces sp. NPDC006743 TaxID=3154480 RepID=UPI003451513D